MPEPEGGRDYFTGRSISEEVTYPWLRRQRFRGAMSGWQTRTLERPQPYTLHYLENISQVKTEFLNILNAVASNHAQSADILTEFFRLELVERAKKDDVIQALSKTDIRREMSLTLIIDSITQHFSQASAARLPVLALYAVYQTMMPHIARYKGLILAELEEHSAADEHTGAIGDVEVKDTNGKVIEAVEVKHDLSIDDGIVRRAYEKAITSPASRYYILSTNHRITITSAGSELIGQLYREHGCELILNGVIPTIKYYLRLLDQPSQFLTAYQQLVVTDRRVTREQQECWKVICETWETQPPA